MTYKSVSFNSFTPVSTPTVVNGIAIDGYVASRPVTLRRLGNGSMTPSIGSVLPTLYGTAQVVGYDRDKCKMKIVKFSDSFEYELSDGSDIQTAEEYVASISRAMNVGVQSMRDTFTRLYKSDITGQLSKRNVERMEDSYPFYGSDEVVVTLKSNWAKDEDLILVREIGTPKETPQERARNKAMARALKALASVELDECPDDIADDIAEEFGGE